MYATGICVYIVITVHTYILLITVLQMYTHMCLDLTKAGFGTTMTRHTFDHHHVI